MNIENLYNELVSMTSQEARTHLEKLSRSELREALNAHKLWAWATAITSIAALRYLSEK